MAHQPILNSTLPALGGLHMYATESTSYYTQNTTPVDGAHIHPCYEIYVNVSGDISFLHENSICDIRPGDVIVSHPGDVHYCIYRASCTHGHFCIWFLGEEVGAFLARRGIRGKVRPAEGDVARLFRLARALTDTAEDPFIRAAELMEFLVLLDTEGEKKHERPGDTPPKLEEMLSYIDAHLLTVSGGDELARVFFTSESTVNRMFKRHIGISVGKLIEAKRLSLAEKLLRADLSVTETCYRAGFSDCSRFILAFKKKFGKTPLKYKQDLLKSRLF